MENNRGCICETSTQDKKKKKKKMVAMFINKLDCVFYDRVNGSIKSQILLLSTI